MAAPAPLPTLLAFEAVARRRSFRHGRGRLHLTASAVSHQIARLERTWACACSSAARTACACRRRAAALSRAPVGARGHRQRPPTTCAGVSNSLYVHCRPAPPVADAAPAGFAQAHPEIIAEPVGCAHAQRFRAGQADLDIRYGVPNWPNLWWNRCSHRAAAGQPGLHPRPPASANRAAAGRAADPEQRQRGAVVGLVRRASSTVARRNASACASTAR